VKGFRFPFLASFAAAALVSACGKTPAPALPPAAPPAPITIVAAPEEKVAVQMTLRSSDDVNPNEAGDGSPVVVRVYQLKTEKAFQAADFFAIYKDDRTVLGDERITGDEFVLMPSERRTLQVNLSKETRYIGVIAAYRDIRNAQWRGLVPTPRKGFSVAVERARVVISPSEN